MRRLDQEMLNKARAKLVKDLRTLGKEKVVIMVNDAIRGHRPPIELCDKVRDPWARISLEDYYSFWGSGEWKDFLGSELAREFPKEKVLQQEGACLEYSPKLRKLAAWRVPLLARIPMRKGERYWHGETEDGHSVRAYLDAPLYLWFFYGHGECTGLGSQR